MSRPWTWLLAGVVACLGTACVSNASVAEESSAYETRVPARMAHQGGITEVEVDMGGNGTVIREIAVGFGHSRASTASSCKALCAERSWVAINAGNRDRSLCRSTLSKYYYGFEKDGHAGKCTYLSKDGKVRHATTYYCYCADNDQLEYKWSSKSCSQGWLTYTTELCRSKNSGSSVYRIGGLKGSGSSRKCYAAYLKSEKMKDYDRLCYREKGGCTEACATLGMRALNAGNTGRQLCRSTTSAYHYGFYSITSPNKCYYVDANSKLLHTSNYYCQCIDRSVPYDWSSGSCASGWEAYNNKLCRSRNSGSTIYRPGGLRGSGGNKKCYAPFLSSSKMDDYEVLCLQEETNTLPGGECSYNGELAFCFPSSLDGECGWPYTDESLAEFWNNGHPARPQAMATFKRIRDKAAAFFNGRAVYSISFDCDPKILLYIQYEDFSSDSAEFKDADSADICEKLLESAYQMSDSAQGFTRNCDVSVYCQAFARSFECYFQTS